MIRIGLLVLALGHLDADRFDMAKPRASTHEQLLRRRNQSSQIRRNRGRNRRAEVKLNASQSPSSRKMALG